jgi:nitroreductase
MCTDSSEQKNATLDQILGERRSYRLFRPEFPPQDAVRRIIHAGLLAPFAAAAVGNSVDYFRRFFVMKKGSPSMNAASPLVMAEIHRMSESLHEDMKNNL